MVAIATLKEENGILGAYIREGTEVSKFILGGIYDGIALNTQMLTEAVLAVYPGALFVDSKSFDTWENHLRVGERVKVIENTAYHGLTGVIDSTDESDVPYHVVFDQPCEITSTWFEGWALAPNLA